MQKSRMSDPGAFIKPVPAGAGRLTAGEASSGAEIASGWIDRHGFHSAMVTLTARADLSAGQKLAVGSIVLRTSEFEDGQDPQVYETLEAGELASAGGGEEAGLFSFGVNLSGAYSYIQLAWVPTLDAADTDVADVHGAVALTGASKTPV